MVANSVFFLLKPTRNKKKYFKGGGSLSSKVGLEWESRSNTTQAITPKTKKQTTDNHQIYRENQKQKTKTNKKNKPAKSI